MKKVQLLAAAAVLFTSSAYAQGARDTFRSTANACQGCDVTLPVVRAANQSNQNPVTGFAAIDNCSVVVQGTPNSATDSRNRAVVDQMGTGNRAALYQREGSDNYGLQMQTGQNNQAFANVYGSSNTTLQYQSGLGNSAAINIDEVAGSPINGNNNVLQQRQNGTTNQADIKTFGDRNFASQDQIGTSNSAAINQRTNNSVATQFQTGTTNTAETIQGLPATNASLGQRSCIEQSGVSNQAMVMQNRR